MDLSNQTSSTLELNNNSVDITKTPSINISTVSKASSSNSTTSKSPISGSPLSFNLSPSVLRPNVVLSNFPSIQDLDEEIQEKFVVQELLNVLSGVNSNLITCYNVNAQKIDFSVDPRVPQPLSMLAMEVTPLAGYYYTINRYIEEIFDDFTDGRALQALVSFIEDYMKEYFILVSQLDKEFRKENLSLRNFVFYVNEIMQNMKLLASAVMAIEAKKLMGGAVLSHLHQKAIATTGTERDFCVTMVQKASVPYLHMLEKWIYEGEINDRYSEFLVTDIVTDDDKLDDDDFWEKRYKPNGEKCPEFLAKSLDQIVKAGKYLNVVRHCGKDIGKFQGGKISYSIHTRDYEGKIGDAFSYASKKLLALLMEDYDLLNRLASIKHYFLMDKGDFISQLLKASEDELSKPVGDVKPDRLESIMGLALRTSSACIDDYKNCLQIQLSPYTISDELMTIVTLESESEQPCLQNFQIPAFEGFSFSYEVKWPISLILTRRHIMIYQLVFRHMFFCKHVERQLNDVWISYKGSPERKSAEQRKEQVAVFSLRSKMLEFVQNLLYYMSFEVIEPAWKALLESIEKVSSVDEVMECHQQFVMGLLEDSMLTEKELLKPITKILRLCLRFCKKIMYMYQLNVRDAGICDKLMLADLRFSEHLVAFLKTAESVTSRNIGKTNKIGNIITRLNFNGYYSESLETTVSGSEMPGRVGN